MPYDAPGYRSVSILSHFLSLLTTAVPQKYSVSISQLYNDQLYKSSSRGGSVSAVGSGGSSSSISDRNGEDLRPSLVLGTVDAIVAWFLEALCLPAGEIEKLATSSNLTMTTLEHLSRCTLLRMPNDLPSHKLRVSDCHDVVCYRVAHTLSKRV